MALSDIARGIVKTELDNRKGGNSSRNSVTYEVETGLKDPNADGNVARVSFTFSKPVSEDLLETQTAAILNRLANSLDVVTDLQINALFGTILGQKRAASIGKKRTRGNVNVNFGDPSDADGEAGAIRSAAGRYVSQSNFRSALEILAKSYLIRDMQSAGAHLKFRTGRFANSLKISSASLNNLSPNDAAPQLDVRYTYMTRPYSVFDPRVSTYRKLSLTPFKGARNPQLLIGDAIAKALRDLVHSRYSLVVGQGT